MVEFCKLKPENRTSSIHRVVEDNGLSCWYKSKRKKVHKDKLWEKRNNYLIKWLYLKVTIEIVKDSYISRFLESIPLNGPKSR